MNCPQSIWRLVRRVAYGGCKGRRAGRRLRVLEDAGTLPIVAALELRLAERGWLADSRGGYRKARQVRS
jgi:hypothetical protein